MSSSPAPPPDQLSLVKRTLLALEEMQAKLDTAERARTEPIAIVGLGCRFPGGADTPDAYWRLLERGVDAIREVPRDRFDVDAWYDPEPATPGKMNSRWAGFLDRVDEFDAAFFGISPREAAAMDPQQRLLLEVAWEALEDAGQTRRRLAGSRAAVYAGITSAEYGWLAFRDPEKIDAYSGTGTSLSILAGRLGYVLDLQGPSMALDTACSSSLVAVHLAIQALRARDCDLAVAGGVNVILGPGPTVLASQMRMMAADGRCKPFDARADGFVRGEGCGVVVLRRLSDALADGDRILALARGSAVNGDGRTVGLTAPNGLSQQAVIRRALEAARVDPAQVGYVEAHGTGTPLGDPIELEALAGALGGPRADGRRCAVGSVKSNFGHLEAAAGVAGFMKAVLALRHGAIPRVLHFQKLNPNITLDGTPFYVPTETQRWPEGASRVAGVSSFGWSGTNAHVVLEAAPPPAERAAADDHGAQVLPLSAHTPEALRALARAHRDALRADENGAAAPVRDHCFTAALRRTHHEHRLAVVGRSRAELARGLDAHLAGEAAPGVAAAHRPSGGRRVVFVFPGQGGQWPGMARDLVAAEPVFREALERCARAFAAFTDWSLLDVVTADPPSPLLERIDVLQPTLFAIQVGLAALLRSLGVAPDAVVGHSMGEVAAAHVAGALSLEDAARVMCRRSQLLRRVSGRGAMAVVELPLEAARRAIGAYADRVSVAAANGPTTTVLSGDPAALAELQARLEAEQVFVRPVKVDVASHSPQVDELRADLLAALAGLRPRAGTVPLYSTVTDRAGDGAGCDAGYWVKNLREPVLFAPALERLVADGHDLFVELSPHPTLTLAVAEVLRRHGVDGGVVACLRRDEPARLALCAAAGELWAHGAELDWARLLPHDCRVVTLPAYPFERRRYWLDDAAPAAPARAAGVHPLLGRRLALAHLPGAHIWETDLDLRTAGWLDDHRVQGAVIMPGAGYVELAMAAAAELGPGPHVVGDVEFRRLLFLSEGETRTLQVGVTTEGDRRVVQVHSRQAGAVAWTLHARAAIAPEGTPPAAERVPLEAIRGRCPDEVPAERFYRQFAERGNEWGPRFQGIAGLRRGEREALAELRAPEAIRGELAAFRVHPALLDACLQVLGATVPVEATGSARAFVPVGVERVLAHRAAAGAEALFSHARLRPDVAQAAGDFVGDVRLCDAAGAPIVELLGLRGRSLDLDADLAAPERLEEWLYEVEWVPAARREDAARPAARGDGAWLIFADSAGVGDALAQKLEARGDRAVLVRPDAAPDLDRLIADTRCRGIFHLSSLDAPAGDDAPLAEIAAAQARGCGAVVALVQALGRAELLSKLWLATRGAQRVGSEAAIAAAQAPLWGLGRTLPLEHPGLWGGLVDLDPAASPAESAAALRDEALAGDGEDQLALRAGRRYAARLVRHRAAPARAAAVRPDATYLVTGGLGGLGLVVARFLVERGARHLILAGRSGLPPDDPRFAAVRELCARGAEVRVAALDVADEERLGAFLAALRAEGAPPVRGVIHAAGVADLLPVQELTPAALDATLRPKLGAWALHRQLAGEPLDFFVLYSSMSSLLASPLLAAYAAGNAFLDALAAHRRAKGQPALAVGWGFWEEVGMAVRFQGETGRESPAAGMGSFSPARGLEALERLLAGAAPHVGVMPMSWWRWQKSHPTAARLPLYERLVPSPGRGAAGDAGEPALELRTDADAQAYLRRRVARVLRLPDAQLDVRRPLNALGLDSLMAVELKNQIERELGVAVPMVTLLKGPCVAELAGVLLERVRDRAGAPAGPPLPAIVPDPTRRHEAFPLNEIQQAYWLGRTGFFELGNVAAHMYLELDLTGIDLERLSRAWGELVLRHDMLRAVVLPDGQQQVLTDLPRATLPVDDLRGLASAGAAAALEATRDRLSHEVRDTETWPLYELRLSRLDDRRARLHLSVDILITDIWSWQVLFREWEQLYADPGAALEPLELTFRDYVTADAAQAATEAHARALAYWRERLPALPPAPDLPLSCSPRSIERPRFVRRTARLEAEAWRRLKARAARTGITSSGLLLTAFADVLATWSKSPRFTINVTLFNRLPLHPQVKDIVGDFTSVNLLAVDAAGDLAFEARARRLQEQLWQDLEHNRVSGVSVLRELLRAQGGMPHAAMPIVFTSTLGHTRDDEGLPIDWLGEVVYGIAQTPQVWIDHQVFEQKGALVYNWDAVEALFPAGLLDDMFAAYRGHLERLAADEASFARVERELAPPAQRALFAAANATEAPVTDALLHELFERRAAAQPHRTAVVAGVHALTYGELVRHARALGHRLRTLGARPGQLVAVVMEKGWEQVAAALGVLEAGAAYLPIAPSLPPERLRHLLEHGQVEVALTQPWLADRVAWPAGVTRVVVDGEPPAAAPPLPPAQRPDDLAYVIYTSGSTGLPKGVMIDHRGAVNTVLDVNERFGVGPDDRVLALSSLSFDLSVWDVFGTLAAGGTIVLPDPAGTRDPGHWAELILRHGVTVWDSVPALMEALVDYVADRPELAPRSLRLVLMSGDWIPVALPDRIRALVPGVELISMGGATEASIWSILYPIGAVPPTWTSIPYGRAMRNQRFHVLSEVGEPCPVGVPGQLHIGGVGLALGYWRDEDKTRASFFVHPRTGERLYRTGDLGRWLPDGNIEFLGREDFQVKIRGHRIELGEIEAALADHPAVRAAVVAAVGDPRGSRRLCAYWVPRDAAAPAEADELRRHLAARLPEYMVPAAFVLLDALPLSPTGKVDRRALPAPDAAGGAPERAFTPPRSAMEKLLAGIWQEVLQVERVSVDDDFFEHGGDSLLLTRALGKLRAGVGQEIAIADLFGHTTIRGLAEHLERKGLRA